MVSAYSETLKRREIRPISAFTMSAISFSSSNDFTVQKKVSSKSGVTWLHVKTSGWEDSLSTTLKYVVNLEKKQCK